MRILSKKPRDLDSEDEREDLVVDRVRRPGPWPSTGAFGTRVFMAGMGLAMLAGPAALGLTMARAGQPAAAVSGQPSSAVSDQDGRIAQASAEYLVQRFLSATKGQEDQLRAMVQQPPQHLKLPEKRSALPSWVGAVHATKIAGASSRWNVTVLSTTPTSTAAWQVSLDVVAGQGRAVALPVQASLPQDVEPVGGKQLQLNHPAAQAGAGFVNALLTGKDDITRWATPGYEPTALNPPTCQSTSLDQATALSNEDPAPTPATRASIQLLVTLTCAPAVADPSASVQPTGESTPPPSAASASSTASQAPEDSEGAFSIQMLLQISGRDGRWEVSPLPAASSAAPQPSTPTP